MTKLYPPKPSPFLYGEISGEPNSVFIRNGNSKFFLCPLIAKPPMSWTKGHKLWYSIIPLRCQAFCPVVCIGPPAPSPASEYCPPPPFGSWGRHTHLRERGWGDPIRETGQKLLVLCTVYYKSFLPWNASDPRTEVWAVFSSANAPEYYFESLLICFVYSVFCGVIFLSEISNPTGKG